MSSLWCICASIVYIKNLFGQCNKIARVPLTSRAESALVINMSLFRVVFHSIICFLSPKRLHVYLYYITMITVYVYLYKDNWHALACGGDKI